MKTLMAAIGGVITFAFILGSLQIIDFHLCIKAAGECQKIESKT